jgi:hypothetical protein
MPIEETTECAECGKPVMVDCDASTYCGTVHEEECLEAHKRHCSICDEDGEYHGKDAEETDDEEAA